MTICIPPRIVVGECSERAEVFDHLSKQGALKRDVPILLTDNTEAVAIKLLAHIRPCLVSVYRMVMKSGSDNFRASEV